MKKEYRKDFKEVEKVFKKLDYIFQGISSGYYFIKYFNIIVIDEKKHRKISPEGYNYNISVNEASRYFAVKWLVEALEGKHIPTIKDILMCRNDWIMAHSIFQNYPEEVKKAFEGINIEAIKKLDYAELVKE